VSIPIWALILCVLVAFPIDGATAAAKLGNVLARLAFAGGMGWLLYGTGYRITDRKLILRSGPLFLRIALDRIEAVAPCSYWMWTGIAWGMGTDTLRIDYRGLFRCARITPADKQGFLRALAERCPQLELRNDRLVVAGEKEERRGRCSRAVVVGRDRAGR
jgi:hypothetical protein